MTVLGEHKPTSDCAIKISTILSTKYYTPTVGLLYPSTASSWDTGNAKI